MNTTCNYLEDGIKIADDARVDESSISTGIICRTHVASLGGGKPYINGDSSALLSLHSLWARLHTYCPLLVWILLLLPLPNLPSIASLGANMVILLRLSILWFCILIITFLVFLCVLLLPILIMFVMLVCHESTVAIVWSTHNIVLFLVNHCIEF